MESMIAKNTPSVEYIITDNRQCE